MTGRNFTSKLMVKLEFTTPSKVEARGLADADTVRAWIASGELPAVNAARDPKGGRPSWKIREIDLEEFLQKRSNRPAAVAPSPPRRSTTTPKRPTAKIKFF